MEDERSEGQARRPASYRLTIKDLPEDERPRERLLKYGPQALKTSELLAIIIRLGNAEETAVQVAEKLLQKYDGDLRRLAGGTEKQLSDGIKGLGKSKAAQIMAAFELGKRLSAFAGDERPQISSSRDVARIFMPRLRYLSTETLHVLSLDAKSYVTKQRRIFEGSLDVSIVHPREIFKFALEESAAAIIIIHNHPSGDPTPSKDDVKITKQLVEAGKVLDIPVLDHIVIGDGRYVSLREQGIIA
jgi:DNA repair protein RadC